MFETFECSGQNFSISSCQFSNDKSIALQTFHHYSVSAHNSSVKSKLRHFWLWNKVSHESPNFDSFKCSGENLQNSLCHFPNSTSVFIQILHVSSASPKITPLYLLGQMLYNSHKMDQSKCKSLRLLSASIKMPEFLVNFEIAIGFSSYLASLFSVMRYNSSVLF